MQKGSIAERIRFEDCMKTGKLNCIKPNYIRKSGERNLGRWGTLPAERDLPNISRCLCCSCYKLEQLKVIPEKQLSRSLGFFMKSNLFLYFASPVFYHTECATILKQLVFLFALLEQGWMKQEWGLEWEQGLVLILWVTFLVQESMNTHKVLFCCTGWPSLISMASSHSCLPFSKAIFSLLCIRHQVHIA